MNNAWKLSADAEAVWLVECGKYRILSLDVFDTTAWRTFPAATDLFYSVGHPLLREGLLFPFVSAASFAQERIEAEREARTKAGRFLTPCIFRRPKVHNLHKEQDMQASIPKGEIPAHAV